jgi:DNA-binding IclR family transcriptional regulator
LIRSRSLVGAGILKPNRSKYYTDRETSRQAGRHALQRENSFPLVCSQPGNLIYVTMTRTRKTFFFYPTEFEPAYPINTIVATSLRSIYASITDTLSMVEVLLLFQYYMARV